MLLALREAELASLSGEVPIAALVICAGKVISKYGNMMNTLCDATAHAEMLVLRDAQKRINSRFLTNCDLYVTLEPCAMCSGAIALSRIKRLYFGAYDVKSGAVYNGAQVFNSTSCHHKPEVYGGIMEKECAKLLTDFFYNVRNS